MQTQALYVRGSCKENISFEDASFTFNFTPNLEVAINVIIDLFMKSLSYFAV